MESHYIIMTYRNLLLKVYQWRKRLLLIIVSLKLCTISISDEKSKSIQSTKTSSFVFERMLSICAHTKSNSPKLCSAHQVIRLPFYYLLYILKVVYPPTMSVCHRSQLLLCISASSQCLSVVEVGWISCLITLPNFKISKDFKLGKGD